VPPTMAGLPRRQRVRRAALWSVCGGLAFWLPLVLIDAVFGWRADLIPSNLASLAGLGILAGTTRIRRITPSWGWILTGIYVLGPAAMLLGGSLTQVPGQHSIPGEARVLVLISLIPPMTLWLALLNGMIFSVLPVTVVLAVMSGRQQRVAA